MRLTLLLLLLSAGLTSLGQLTVNTFDQAVHMGANTITETFDFPDDVSSYSEILMHFNLTCPAGGCDPWDRYSNLKVVKNGQSYEIGRYVTPYQNSWCDWTLDVTAYRELLQGQVTMESFIDTWNNGWEITVDFEFIEGTPDYLYSRVTNLWVDYFIIYGDTIFYSIDLPEMDVLIPDNAESSMLRIMNTGHGQGNTENAAEFSQKTHEIMVNGNQEFSQFLWKNDCDVNPCSPQSGTWEFSRAGWCPGQEVVPWDYDVTSITTPGEVATFDYVLEPYFNFCSPWNPDCNNSTCAECNYNSGTHTQPHYKLATQLIFFSNTPFPVSVEEIVEDVDFTIYPNPALEELRINYAGTTGSQKWLLSVYDTRGSIVKTFTTSESTAFNIMMDVSDLAPGTYLLSLSGNDKNIQRTFIKH